MSTKATRIAILIALGSKDAESMAKAESGECPDWGAVRLISKQIVQMGDVLLFDLNEEGEHDVEAFTFEDEFEAEFAFVTECKHAEMSEQWQMVAALGAEPDMERCTARVKRELIERLGLPQDLIDALEARAAREQDMNLPGDGSTRMGRALKEQEAPAMSSGTGFYL